jgi:hypothetical protein
VLRFVLEYGGLVGCGMSSMVTPPSAFVLVVGVARVPPAAWSQRVCGGGVAEWVGAGGVDAVDPAVG